MRSHRQLVLTLHDLHQLRAKTDTRPDHTPRRLTPSNTCANTCARIGRTRPLFPKSRWKVSTGAGDRVSSKPGASHVGADALPFGRERAPRVAPPENLWSQQLSGVRDAAHPDQARLRPRSGALPTGALGAATARARSRRPRARREAVRGRAPDAGPRCRLRRGGAGQAPARRRRVGVDASAAMLAQAPSRTTWQRGTALPFSDGSFRSVALLYALYHLPDPALALGEARRCCNPAGSSPWRPRAARAHPSSPTCFRRHRSPLTPLDAPEIGV
jgi:hypothetical protein